jgi:regulator of sigma E protease
VLELTAFISVNLAIVNLLPIPALDGGRLAVLGIEVITRRRIPRLLVQTVNTIGVAFLIALMIIVSYHDIGRSLM